MKMYIRKTFVILITILTLGMYVPPPILNTDAAEVDSSKEKVNDDTFKRHEMEWSFEAVHSSTYKDRFWSLHDITNLAKMQTITKLGPKIIDSVDETSLDTIMWNIEEVITSLLQDKEDAIYYYGISEELAPGYGEKIFNIYDIRTNEDIARFHVSRINKPMEGYYFNFHYHLSEDNFEEHYPIGEIYYHKNTPPKWMAH